MNRSTIRTTVMALSAFLAVGCSEDATSPITELEKIDVVIGTGAEAVNGRTVRVIYTGWLWDKNTADHHGRKFDSSRDRGETYSFVLGTGNVIAGWHQGILGMKVGGHRTIIIPPQLGYGSQGSSPLIPGNAALVFDIELVSVQ